MRLAILFLCVLFLLFYLGGLVFIAQLWLVSGRRSGFDKLAGRSRPPRSKAA